jgi:hypothetical protein
MPAQWPAFDNQIPRIILWKDFDGRKMSSASAGLNMTCFSMTGIVAVRMRFNLQQYSAVSGRVKKSPISPMLK